MRIAMISAAKSIHTIKWVRALKRRGHTVALYSLPNHKAPAGALSGIETHYLSHGGVGGYYFGASELSRLLKAFKPDIVNAHYATGYGTLAYRCGVHPLLLSVWGSDVYDFPYQGRIQKHIVLRNLKGADAIASTSHAMACQVMRICPFEPHIYITPFGVDTIFFNRKGKPPADRLTIGIVKALEPKYGVEYLIRAFPLLKSRLLKQKLMPSGGMYLEIYGGGSLLPQLKAETEKLGLTDFVHFHGAVPHTRVPSIISGFDIFCAPSISDSESFGVAAVEAMSCGVPVVAGNVDGFREVMVDGETGFLVPPRDPATLANKLFELSCNKELRLKMGECGRRHVTECYEWEDCVTLMENALTEVVTNFKRGACRKI